MVEIPAGEFLMGSTEEEVEHLNKQWAEKYARYFYYQFYNEAPQMIVYLDTYSIDQYKVSNNRYRHCVEAGVCTPLSESEARRVDTLDDSYATQVAWVNANMYCQWVGKRLPTEAEWEKAARGTDGKWYPWGNEHNLMHYAHNPSAYEPVHQYPNGASLYGVVGQLDRPAEWTADWYQIYPGNAAVYPDLDTSSSLGGDGGNLYTRGYRAARGGGFPEEERARVARRGGVDPANTNLSFRCVLGLESMPLEQAIVRTTAPTPVPTLVPAAEVDLSNMAYIPSGEFVMGTDEVQPSCSIGFQTGIPQHIVYLDAFYIDRTEVTRQEFADFLNALGTHRRACGGFDCGWGGLVFDRDNDKYIVGGFVFEETEGKYVEDLRYANRPADGVTWYGAQAYCTWMGKQLPTEAEWEKTARGTDGRWYPWGNEPDEDVFSHSKYSVGTLSADTSPYGVMGMLSNVGEWVADWYTPDYYVYSLYSNPPGPTSGESNVIRGLPHPNLARVGVTIRWSDFPHSSYGIGFRCAYSPGQ
jgi:formylglycine-generating enzyme required for sulfatase activity